MTLVGEAGHGTKALRTDVLLQTPVLIPPSNEQEEIATWVQSKKMAWIKLIKKSST
jgi:type I restriction enzyme S subunit